MADSAGVVYTGELDTNGKYTGFGRLEYTETGITYEGMFLDGLYHGEGKLLGCAEGGAEYVTFFERGVEVPRAGTVQFPDGLVFNPAQNLPEGAPVEGEEGVRKIGLEWEYLSGSIPGGHDRRLWEEHQAGVRAAVASARSPAKLQHGNTLQEQLEEEERAAQASIEQKD
jgi:hypothetical protein